MEIKWKSKHEKRKLEDAASCSKANCIREEEISAALGPSKLCISHSLFLHKYPDQKWPQMFRELFTELFTQTYRLLVNVL